MRYGLLLSVCVIIVVACCIPAGAIDKKVGTPGLASSEWPQWRGPHRDAISSDTGLLAEWPKDGPPLAWTSEGLGKGFASVSIADGRIFTMGDRNGAQVAIALKLADGSELWQARISDPREKSYEGPRCTPSVDGALVYVIGTYGDVVCLEAPTGKEVWRRNFPQDFKGKMHSGWGFSESPLVDGDRLICTPGGPDAGIVALNKKTGADMRRSVIPQKSLGDKGGDGAGYSSVVVSNGAGVKQYVQLMGRGVVGVAADTGKFLWGYNRVANKTANIPTPIVHDDYVFCSSGYGDGGAALLKLKKSDGGVTAEEVYYLGAKELQNHHGGMIMLGDYIYFGHGHNNGFPTCIEWKTGNVVWGKNRGPGSGSAAVVYADGNIYFRFQNGLVALIAASPKGYEVRGTFQIPGSDSPSWPHPVIAGGKLYLRDQDKLFCYDLKKS